MQKNQDFRNLITNTYRHYWADYLKQGTRIMVLASQNDGPNSGTFEAS